MNHPKSLFLLIALSLSLPQWAQATEVDIYGIADIGFHFTNSKYGDSSLKMTPGISKGSRIGLRGSERLGKGYAVVFNLESGFSLNDGAFDNTKNRLSTAMLILESNPRTEKFALDVRERWLPV